MTSELMQGIRWWRITRAWFVDEMVERHVPLGIARVLAEKIEAVGGFAGESPARPVEHTFD